MNKDMVNHPSHYETGNFECIDVMLETQGVDAVKSFCICNAFKYLYRNRNKNGLEDIKKAIWYLNKYIELTESVADEVSLNPDKTNTIVSRIKDFESFVEECRGIPELAALITCTGKGSCDDCIFAHERDCQPLLRDGVLKHIYNNLK